MCLIGSSKRRRRDWLSGGRGCWSGPRRKPTSPLCIASYWLESGYDQFNGHVTPLARYSSSSPPRTGVYISAPNLPVTILPTRRDPYPCRIASEKVRGITRRCVVNNSDANKLSLIMLPQSNRSPVLNSSRQSEFQLLTRRITGGTGWWWWWWLGCSL